MYAGIITALPTTAAGTDTNTGVLIGREDLTTALTADKSFVWYAPVVTMVYRIDTADITTKDGFLITFET